MLDRTMIDYIITYVDATSNLKDCMRSLCCLLYLKKSRYIRCSHYCPRKILERLSYTSGCHMPNNMKVLYCMKKFISCGT